MCVKPCECRNCKIIFNRKMGLDCTNCPSQWDNKDVDCTFGNGVQNCKNYNQIEQRRNEND